MMLSNLLQLQNTLDPTTTSLLSSTAGSPTVLLSSTAAAPLLFFTITSDLSYIASSTSTSTNSKKRKSTTDDEAQNSSKYSAAFRAMSTERIWHMDPSLRDSVWGSTYGLPHPVFTTVVDKLKPYCNDPQQRCGGCEALQQMRCRIREDRTSEIH